MSFSSNAIQGLWAKGHTPELYRVILAVIASIRIDKGSIDYFYSLNLCEHINNEHKHNTIVDFLWQFFGARHPLSFLTRIKI